MTDRIGMTTCPIYFKPELRGNRNACIECKQSCWLMRDSTLKHALLPLGESAISAKITSCQWLLPALPPECQLIASVSSSEGACACGQVTLMQQQLPWRTHLHREAPQLPPTRQLWHKPLHRMAAALTSRHWPVRASHLFNKVHHSYTMFMTLSRPVWPWLLRVSLLNDARVMYDWRKAKSRSLRGGFSTACRGGSPCTVQWGCGRLCIGCRQQPGHPELPGHQQQRGGQGRGAGKLRRRRQCAGHSERCCEPLIQTTQALLRLINSKANITIGAAVTHLRSCPGTTCSAVANGMAMASAVGSVRIWSLHGVHQKQHAVESSWPW